MILRAVGRKPLLCRRGRRAQRLEGVALSIVRRNDLRDRVEWPALKFSRLLEAGADEPIYDRAEGAAAGPGARGFNRLRGAGASAIAIA